MRCRCGRKAPRNWQEVELFTCPTCKGGDRLQRPFPTKPKGAPAAPSGRYKELIIMWQDICLRDGLWPKPYFIEVNQQSIKANP
jgi:hypothetical protein